MMSDHRKVINPLLNVSVTGATLEDFSQHAVLLPAAEAPPVLQPVQLQPPPTLQPTSEISLVPNQEDLQNYQPIQFSGFANNNQQPAPENYNFYSPPINSNSNSWGGQYPQQQQQQDYSFPQQQPQQPFIQPEFTVNSNFPPQPQSIPEQQPAGLQSVFSSFSSYLKLGGSRPQEEQVTAVPSVVDSLLSSVDPNAPVASAAPVQFYSPDTTFSAPSVAELVPTVPLGGLPSPVLPTGPPPATSNTYRRGGFKRPAYAQIPGLTAGAQVAAPPPVQLQPNIPPLPVAVNPVHLPPRPPSTHSPYTLGSTNLNIPSGTSDFGLTALPSQVQPAVIPSIPLIPVSTVSVPPSLPVLPVLPAKQPTPPPPTFQHQQQILHLSFLPVTPQVPQIPTPKVEAQSPFLSPVSVTEEIQLASIPTIPNTVPTFDTSATPTILTPSTYYPATSLTGHSTLLNTEMSKTIGDSPRASPGLNAHRADSTEQPILTHNETTQMYRPVYHHWFYKTASDTKVVWTPFSMMDSLNLDSAYLSPDLSPDRVEATDGGRYDVNILLRERVPVYWEGPKAEVRRCSWFHKGNTDGRYVPYEENVATKLEEEFKIAFETNTWNRRVDLANGESVVFHGPDVLVLFPQTQCPDSWGNTPNQPRPRVVKRGLDEFHIEEGEPPKVDHLLFMVHGIGKFCDLKFRGVEEAVDEFRSMALQLVQSHYRSSCEKEIANRIEILPISWHSKLHSEETGVDKKIKGITLESIPRLREFTNDTILDVLFYTSPVYCQTIISSVGNELNRVYELFKQRNPSFTGGVSLGGHSLGSLILFDILCHQQPENEKPGDPETPTGAEPVDDQLSPLKPPPNVRKMSRRISYMMAQMGTGQAQINYPHLHFQPRHFFALGSPVGMFVMVRGLENLGEQFALPTCQEYFNIFHPYDPVAYRIETLINPELANLKPVLIPHHKGRKRMHLELKETMARVGADLKQKLIDSMKNTWNSFYQFTLFKGQTTQANPPSLEEEVNKVLEEQLKQDGNTSDEDSIIEAEQTDLNLGQLNGGRRVDYVLQEAPLEFFNEYIFALTSHVCYWESNDTILLIVKEIYNSKNISADSQIPQQTMKIERTTSTSSNDDTFTARGMDPTVPMHANTNIGPPPMAGFVRKS